MGQRRYPARAANPPAAQFRPLSLYGKNDGLEKSPQRRASFRVDLGVRQAGLRSTKIATA